MQHRTAAGLAAITAVALLGGATVFAAQTDRPAHREGGMRQMRMHPGFMPIAGALCGPHAGERLDRALDGLESFAKFEGDQRASWTHLRETMQEAQPQVQQVCMNMRESRKASSVEKLAAIHDSLGQAATIVARLQPAYAEFYATLDDAQKKTLDEVF